jgi:hypothetical protein
VLCQPSARPEHPFAWFGRPARHGDGPPRLATPNRTGRAFAPPADPGKAFLTKSLQPTYCHGHPSTAAILELPVRTVQPRLSGPALHAHACPRFETTPSRQMLDSHEDISNLE